MNKQLIVRELKLASREMRAGHEDVSIRANGMTLQEAYARAEDELRRDSNIDYWKDLGTKVIREPKRATKVKVEKKTVQKGKVEKAFTIETKWQRDGEGKINRDRRYTSRYQHQGEVLKAAKELALEYGVELRIQLEAFCVGNTHLATVIPSGSRPGEWVFSFDVHT